jgi:hypothetical protein
MGKMLIRGYGPVAQLGERLVRNQEVEGSIPFGSTNEKLAGTEMCLLFYFPHEGGIEPMRWVSVKKTINNRF